MPDQEACKPHPRNAPGQFVVEDGVCMTCGMPEWEAPDLITGTEAGHCYFKKQPETPDEVEQAVRAIVISCCGAVRYLGEDPAVLQRLRTVGTTTWQAVRPTQCQSEGDI